MSHFSRAVLYSIFFCVLCGRSVDAEVLTLYQGLRLAVQNSRDIKIAEQEEAVSENDAYIAGSRLLPSVNASFNKTVLAYQPTAIFGPQHVPTAEKTFMSYGINMQQLLYDFGGSISYLNAAKVATEAKKSDTARIRNAVEFDFVLIYLDLLESEKLIAVAEKEAETLESHLRDARSLFDAGVITKNDLLQADVKLSDARQRLAGMRNNREISAARLNNALIRRLGTVVQVEDISENSSDAMYADIEKAWAFAEKQRPEIQVIDATFKELGLEETAKKSENYPAFFLQGGYDRTENRYQLYEGNWSLTLGLKINLFSGGRTKAEASRIGHKRLEIIEQKNRIVDGIRLEIEKYILSFKTAKEKLSVTKDAIKQADENLRINRIRYEEGVGTATEVLDAVVLLTVAETNYYRSVYDLKRAEAGVMYSIGRDLQEVYR